MKRDIQALAEKKFDIFILGGGISGVCIAYEGASRGLRVGLVDKNDFGAGTSSATSKLIHGGLRYLKQMKLKLVRESLNERRIMMQIAPHLVYPIPFVIPTYNRISNLILRIGLTLYDIISFDRNRIKDPDKKIPHHRVLTKEEVLELAPGVSRQGLIKGLLYYDCQMPAPDRLTWSFVASAIEKGALVLNYAKIKDMEISTEKSRNVLKSCTIVDTLTGEKVKVKSDLFINATGPWADQVLSLSKKLSEQKIKRSKGIHLITRALGEKVALTLQTRNKRHLFIIPWRGFSLIGTTDEEYLNDPDHLRVTEEDINRFLTIINQSYQGANLTRADVFHSYAGIRPLVTKGNAVPSYKASRKYEIIDHSIDDDLFGLLTVIGGKYTTSRNLSENVINKAFKILGKKAVRSQTSRLCLYGGDTGNINDYIKQELKDNSFTISAELLEFLVRNYGTKYKEVIGPAIREKKLLSPVVKGNKNIWAQVIYSVKKEMALSLQDVLLRRTGIATAEDPGLDVVNKVAICIGNLLGWDVKKRKEEVAAYYKAIENAP